MLKIRNFISNTKTPIEKSIALCIESDRIPAYDTIRVNQESPLLQSFFASSTFHLLPDTESFFVGYVLDADIIYDEVGVCWYGAIISIPDGYNFDTALKQMPSRISFHANSFCNGPNGTEPAMIPNGYKMDQIFPDGNQAIEDISFFLEEIKKIKNADMRHIMGRIWLVYTQMYALKHLGRYVDNQSINRTIIKSLKNIVAPLNDSHGIMPVQLNEEMDRIFLKDKQRAHDCYAFLWTNL